MNLIEELKARLFTPADRNLSGIELLRKARALIASLPLIAQAMVESSNHRIMVRSTTSGGCTNGRTVWIQGTVLPRSEMAADEFVVNVALQLGLLHHEVGHVNGTDFNVVRPPGLVHHLTGIFEDVRQELRHIAQNRAGRKYLDALSIATLVTGMNRPVVPEDGPLGVLTGYILFRTRAQYRGEPWFEALADQAEEVMESMFPKGICMRLDFLLDEVATLRSTQHALDLAHKVAAFLEAERDAAQQAAPEANSADSAPESPSSTEASSSQQDAGADADDSDAGCGADASDASDGECGNDDADGASAGNDDGNAADPAAGSDNANGDGGPAAAQSGSGSPSPQAQALQDVIDGNDPDSTAKSDFDDAVRQLLESRQADLHSKGNGASLLNHDLSMPAQPDRKPVALGESVDLDAAVLASSRMRNRLVQLLQADSLTKTSVGTRGSALSAKHLARVAVDDARLFKRVRVGRTVDTAIVLVADTSGSMSGAPIQLLNQALYASALAIQACPDAELGIVAFPGRQSVLGFGQPPRRYREHFTLCAGGGTPLHEGVMHGLKMLSSSRKARKVMIVLTDGEPDSPVLAMAAIEAAEAQGVETIGIGILEMAVTELFRQHVVIEDLQQLSPKLLAALNSQLLRAA